jgi:uncharacterized membrane protein YccF (DUF307 family)
VKTIGNLLWLALAGLWMAVGWALAGVLAIVFIVTIPLAAPAFRMAGYVFWPFGRTVIKNPERGRALSAIGNVVWIVLFGWWLALVHIITGALLCLTIIGIPFGVANMKLAALAIAPYGKAIVSKKSLVPGQVVVGGIPERNEAPAATTPPQVIA